MRRDILKRRRGILGAAFAFLLLGAVIYAPYAMQREAQAAGTISGRVFQDYNGNGFYNTSGGTAAEPRAVDRGLGGVTVTVYDAAGTAQGSTTSIADGTYNLPTTGTGPYRVEFTNIPAGYSPSARNTDSVNGGAPTDSGTAVQFVADGSTPDVNLALNRPKDFCQNNPLICATTYSIGTANDPTIFTIPYGAGSTRTTGGLPVNDFVAANPSRVNLASVTQVGTTYGMAYSRARKTLYAAAFMKKHAAFGPGGTGAIYRINRDTTGVAEYANLNTIFGAATAGANPHNVNDYDRDNGQATWEAVGKVAFGGMAISDDETKIYVMNLANRTLYEIPLNAAPTSANIRTVAFPTNGVPNCPNPVDVRPFAVSYYENQIYVGAVCSAQTSASSADLRAYVYQLDPATLVFNPAPVFQAPLNYPRLGANGSALASWLAWRTTFASITTAALIYPQPVLSDVDFDNGNLVLSLRDRDGDQTGFKSLSDPNTTNRTKGITAGDVLRACGSVSGGWILESNGRCGGIGGAPQNSNEGPGGGEYYYQDSYHPNGNPHTEVALGGALQLPGYNNMVATIFDPVYVPNDNIYDAGGFRWFVNNTGEQNRGYLAYQSSNFGKANGIGGNLPAFCDLAPIEVGNRVWLDADGNGVQDPGEAPIANATLSLYKNNVPVSYVRYEDRFDNYTYDGSNGAVSWSGTPWSEFGDDGNPTAGDVQVVNSNSAKGYRIRITSGVKGVSRAVNLSGTTAPILMFDYERVNQGLTVQYSIDSGANYITVQTIAPALDIPIQNFAASIPNAATNIRFLTTETGTANIIRLNNFRITANATTVTDANGEYYFSSASGTNASNSIYLANLLPNMNYEIRLDAAANYNSGGALNNLLLTTRNQTSQNGFVAGSDSDALLVTNPTGSPSAGTFAVIPFTTGNAGDSNHTFDAGFTSSPTFSLGNRVWFDTNNDGAINAGEVGIANVSVSVFNDANGDGIPDSPTAVNTINTDANGYYRFDNLAAGSYVVRVNPGNFAGAGVLSGYQNTTGANNTDLDSTAIPGQNGENGINPTGAANSVQTNGILSGTIVLGAPGEPTNEADVQASGQGAVDSAANMTVDFGFYCLSLSGTLWNDTGAGANNNNGQLDPGETPLRGVNVRLFDVNGVEIPLGADGILGTSDDGLGGVVTDSSGNYNFGCLPPGQYRVVVSGGGTSSTPTSTNPDDNIDSDDNGFPGTGTFTGQTVSGLVTLTPGNPGAANNNSVTNSTGRTSNPTVDFGFIVSPTYVKLESFEVSADENGTTVKWSTGEEFDNLGFNVYREVSGKRELINRALIAGSALRTSASLSASGDTYSWTDNNPQYGAVYYLEDIDMQGNATIHGPVTPKMDFSARSFQKRNSFLLPELNKNSDFVGEKEFLGKVKTARTKRKIRTQRRGIMKPILASSDYQKEIAAQKGAKIFVRRDGWYRVSAGELQSTGFDINSNREFWQLFADGQEVPFKLNSDGSVEFFGSGNDKLTTDTKVYYLIEGRRAGLRLSAVEGGIPEGDNDARSFETTTVRDDRQIYVSTILNNDEKNFFGAIINASGATSQQLTVRHPDGAGQINLRVKLQGLSLGDHLVSLRFNDLDLGTVNLVDRENRTFSYDLPINAIVEGANRVQLQSVGTGNDVSLVDSVSLTYPRRYVAVEGKLRFSVPAGQNARVGGFNEENIDVFEIQNGRVERQILTNVENMDDSFGIKLKAVNYDREILAIERVREESAAKVERNNPSTWHDSKNGANFVIITDETLRGSAEQLAKMRISQGLKTGVVLVDDIYDEFSFGEHSPEAIKEFLRTATTDWQLKPQYALLLGDSSWDPRNYLRQTDHDLVPTKLVDATFQETGSDSWLADFDGDGIEDISLGRLPVANVWEAAVLIDKLVRYDNQPTRAQESNVLISDRGFENYNDILQAELPNGVSVARIERSSLSDSAMRDQIIAQLNAGPMIVTYTGHGAPSLWAAASVFRTQDITNIDNRNSSIYLLMTCLNGYNINPNYDSIAETFLKKSVGGAIAVWASSGTTYPDKQLEVSKILTRQIFGADNRSQRFGDMIRMTKQATEDRDVRRTWQLIGDPTIFVK